MEFNDRSAKTKFHIFTSADGHTTIHSSYGNYNDAAHVIQNQKRELPGGSWIGGTADAKHLVPGFDSAQHTTCDYCNKPATHISRESGEPLCIGCAKDQYSQPRESVSKLTPKTVRMYGRS